MSFCCFVCHIYICTSPTLYMLYLKITLQSHFTRYLYRKIILNWRIDAHISNLYCSPCGWGKRNHSSAIFRFFLILSLILQLSKILFLWNFPFFLWHFRSKGIYYGPSVPFQCSAKGVRALNVTRLPLSIPKYVCMSFIMFI